MPTINREDDIGSAARRGGHNDLKGYLHCLVSHYERVGRTFSIKEVVCINMTAPKKVDGRMKI